MEEVKKQGMESLFCPYELALELKELGFNEPCFAIWSGFDENNFSVTDTVRLFSSKFSIDGTQSNTLYINPTDNRVSAPLWQQAARFLYINSNKQINITINGEDNYKRLCEKFKKAIEDFRNL